MSKVLSLGVAQNILEYPGVRKQLNVKTETLVKMELLASVREYTVQLCIF